MPTILIDIKLVRDRQAFLLSIKIEFFPGDEIFYNIINRLISLYLKKS